MDHLQSRNGVEAVQTYLSSDAFPPSLVSDHLTLINNNHAHSKACQPGCPGPLAAGSCAPTVTLVKVELPFQDSDVCKTWAIFSVCGYVEHRAGDERIAVLLEI